MFKTVANQCLIGRDVLATNPETKQHFAALMGTKSPIINHRKGTVTQEGCSTEYGDKSSDDDYD